MLQCKDILPQHKAFKEELLTLPVYLFSFSFSGVRVTLSLVFCVVLRRPLLTPLSFFFLPYHKRHTEDRYHIHSKSQ